jgi:membrane protein DedA with SNARE-associated domain
MHLKESPVDTISQFLSDHPSWIAAALFVVVFAESLILVGYVIPAATILLVAGALAGAGYVDPIAALIGAIGGTAAGSAANFWLGTRFQLRLPGLWPFSRHPELLERNRRFVARHGGKSIVLGRFTKPLRPAVTAVAGMLSMEPARFMRYNLLAAVLWAPAYLGTGYLMASSTSFATRNPLQLSLLLLGCTTLAWVSYVLYQRLLRHRRNSARLEADRR